MPRTITYILARPPDASETFIAREIEALRRRGWTIDVVSLTPCAGLPARSSAQAADDSAQAASLPAPGGRGPPFWQTATATLHHALPLVCCLPRLPLQLLRRGPQVAALAQRIRATQSTRVHAHFAHLPADVALLAAQQAGVPYSCSVHAWDVFAQPAAAIRRRLQPAVAICACSQAAKDAVIAADVDAGKVHLVRHGLPLADYPFAPDRTGRNILAVGRLEPKKGFDVLLSACAQIACQGRARPPDAPRSDPFTCLIIGDGSQRSQLERQVAELGLLPTSSVAAAGGRGLPSRGGSGGPALPEPSAFTVELAGAASPDAVRAAMREAALLVLPSRRLASGDRDGVANVLLEAMALGTPVVTTTAGAAGEVIRDGINGLLVPPEDPAALAAAIASLLDDPITRTRLAGAARATIESDFDEERTIPLLEKLLA